MRVITLTGGIASGKSTVCKILSEYGHQIIDMDKIALQIVNKGEKVLEKIVNYFGRNILKSNGQLNRIKLGNIIFNDQNSRKKLNQIIHPYILNRTNEIINNIYKTNTNKIVIVDVPLFFEKLKSNITQKVILVYTPEYLQIKRLIKRNGYNKKEALSRIFSQISIEQKKNLASIIIDNSGSLEQTRIATYLVLEKIKIESTAVKNGYEFSFDI